jgi:hypothetical protein
MLLTGLLVSPFFASLDVQQGSAVVRDPDIWLHLRNAQMLLSTHHFAWHDAYSFTSRGQTWIDPAWLSEIFYYLGFSMLGERGLFFVMLTAVELVIAGVFLLCYLRSGDVKATFLATWVAVLLATINMGPRTILFGWLCFIAEMLLVQAFRRGHDLIWLMVPLFALWANLHETWLIGLAFLLLFVASGWKDGSWGSIEAARWTPGQRRKLLTITALSVAAIFVNPYGWRLVLRPFDRLFLAQINTAAIDQWNSVNFQSFYGKLIFIVISAMLVLTLSRRRIWPLHELLFVLVAFYFGLANREFLFVTGIVVCPILAIELEGAVFAPYDPRRNKPLLSAAIMAAYLIFAFDRIPTSAELHTAEAQYFPANALPALETNCSDQRTFNLSEWGGYLIWKAPNIPVFIDSRHDVFEYHGVLADDLKAMNMDGSLGILDRYQIGCVLLSPKEQLVYLLSHTPGWDVRYKDSTAELLVRSPQMAKQ